MIPADPAFDHLATARRLLLTPYGLDESTLHKALGGVFAHRADYADLYFQYTRNESFSLEEGIVKSGSCRASVCARWQARRPRSRIPTTSPSAR